MDRLQPQIMPSIKAITDTQIEVTETKTEVKTYSKDFLMTQKSTIETAIAQAQKDLATVNNLLANFP